MSEITIITWGIFYSYLGIACDVIVYLINPHILSLFFVFDFVSVQNYNKLKFGICVLITFSSQNGERSG